MFRVYRLNVFICHGNRIVHHEFVANVNVNVAVSKSETMLIGTDGILLKLNC